MSSETSIGVNATLGSTTDDLILTARKLVPLLASESAVTEELGLLSEKSVAALRGAGFFSIFAPRAWGGHEADIGEATEVFRELGRGSGSSAWVSMLLSCASYLTSMLGERARQDVWGDDPKAAVCGGFGMAQTAERVRGGLRISGRWQPLSGAFQAQWALIGVPIVDSDGNVADRGMALVPMSEAVVEETWHVAGMQGTGSNTVVIGEAVVPDYRVLTFSRLLSGKYADDHPEGTIYSATAIPFASVMMLGPLIGMAEAALDYTLTRLKAGKAISGTIYGNALESPSVQLTLADGAAAIETAKLHVNRAISDVQRGLQAHEQLDLSSRARIRMDLGTAAKQVSIAVRLFLDVGGSSSFSLDRPIQQIWRNIEVASRHQLISYGISREVYARALLELEGQVTPLL